MMRLLVLLLVLPGAAGDCSQPPKIVFAEPIITSNQSYPEGAVVKYKCRPGYAKKGNESPGVTCLANSTWSTKSVFCTRKPCGPPHIENGNFHARTDLLFGATVTFTCGTGYRLVGSPSAECVERNGEVYWNAVPSCEIVLCPPPPAIENGQLLKQNEDFAFGMSASYSCNESLTLVGEATIFCTTDDSFQGVWSSPPPECKEVKCENPDVKNGTKLSNFSTEYTYGDKVSFKCNPGYSMKGNSTVTCEANNTWTPSLPICDKILCGHPPEFPFATRITPVGDSSVPGTTVTYRCDPGYKQALKNSSVITCQSNKTWSAANQLSCIRQQCPAPRVDHGKVVGNPKTFPFEAVVTFTCDPPYKLKHSSAACMVAEDGVDWKPGSPYCGANTTIAGILPLLLAVLVMDI